MEAKFTPGPWIVEDPFFDYLSITVGGPHTYNWRFVAHIHTDCEKGGKTPIISKAQMEANAHLIAAAPELYEEVANSILRVLHIAERLEHKMTGTEKAQLADYASNTAAELACITAKARGESS